MYKLLKKYLLNYEYNKRKKIIEEKHLYFYLASLPVEQRKFLYIYLEKISKKDKAEDLIFLKNKSKQMVYLSKVNSEKNRIINENINYLFLFRHLPNSMFLNKLLNLLMYKGKKMIAYNIILNFFEILKLKFHISNPIKLLMHFIYLNLVPIMKTKQVGYKNKKVLGINLTPYKRVSISLKLFVKGARTHQVPIVTGLIMEFFNFLKKSTTLQKFNELTLKEIVANNLHKFLKVQDSDLMPELTILQNSQVSFQNLYLLEWQDLGYIMFELHKISYAMKLHYQQKILFLLKIYVLLHYSNKVNNSQPLPYYPFLKNYNIKPIKFISLIADKNPEKNAKNISNFVKNNKTNLHYVPYFKMELKKRLKPKDFQSIRTDENFVLLFLGYNPNLLDFKLDYDHFKALHKRIKSVFMAYLDWESSIAQTNLKGSELFNENYV